jgi:hypothetical protein
VVALELLGVVAAVVELACADKMRRTPPSSEDRSGAAAEPGEPLAAVVGTRQMPPLAVGRSAVVVVLGVVLVAAVGFDHLHLYRQELHHLSLL